MSINELLSVDTRKILLQQVSSEFDEYTEKYFKDIKQSDLKIKVNLKIGISEETDLALIQVETRILDTDSQVFIELETSFFFSIHPSEKTGESAFKEIENAAKPYITSEVANIVKNITSQGTGQDAIHLPYTFLS